MAKVKLVTYDYHNNDPMEIQWHYMCLGCGYIHAVSPKRHTFNNDFDKPTFTPSLVQDFTPGRKCHSFIKDGMIQYLSDCFHELKNQTIELPEII